MMETRAPAAEAKVVIWHIDQRLVAGSCWRSRIQWVSWELS